MSKMRKLELLKWEQVPLHLQFNPFVLNGYRQQLTTWGCIKSLIYFHNETINILTHGVPMMFILLSVPYLLPWKDVNIPYLPYTHVISLLSPWTGSFLYHLFMNHEYGCKAYRKLLQIDMLGIWITQSFGALPTIVSACYTLNSFWQNFIYLLYAVLSLCGLIKAMKATNAWERRLCFLYPFLTRIVMLILRLAPCGGGHPDSIPYVILQDVVSVIGGAVGAMRIPERWFPGKLDLMFNSHNIMHVLVVVAIVFMHNAALLDFEWMASSKCNGSIFCPYQDSTHSLPNNFTVMEEL